MLIAKNIIKRYASLQVLKGIDLNINKGDCLYCWCFGGRKSTLLHILGTLDQPDAGSLIIDGQDVTQLGEKPLATFRNEKIGFIFQFHNLLGEFSALENVCMPSFIGGKGDKAVRERAEELLVMLGLKDRINNLPSQMSGGEQQRTAVARALMNSPAIIFADEPSGNLDSKNAQELHELFFTLRDKFQQTFVVVTHNEELANMADRKLIMQDGLIIN
jgi:lipoprotein-releasing system ATP-binding protein